MACKIDLRMKNQCRKSLGFHLEPLCSFGSDFVYANHQWSIFVRFITTLCRAGKFLSSSLRNKLLWFWSVSCIFHSCVTAIEFNYWIMAPYKQNWKLFEGLTWIAIKPSNAFLFRRIFLWFSLIFYESGRVANTRRILVDGVRRQPQTYVVYTIPNIHSSHCAKMKW